MTPRRVRGAACALLAAVGFNVLVFVALGALNRTRPLPPLTHEAARFTLVEPPFVRPRPPEPERVLEPEPPPRETLVDDSEAMEAPAAELTPLDLPLVAPDVTVPSLRIAPVASPQPHRLGSRRGRTAPPRQPKRPPARSKTFGSEEVDDPPRGLDLRHPAYPASARRRGLEGFVTVKLLIDEEGRVQQVGDPRAIYEAPVNRFVADFIGETNILPVRVGGVAAGAAQVMLPGGATVSCPAETGAEGEHHVSIRPERVSLVAPGEGQLRARLERVIYLGTDLQLLARLASGEEVHVRLQNTARAELPPAGAELGLAIEDGAARLLAD